MKKSVSLLVAVLLAVTLVVPMSTINADAAFSVRSSMPSFDSSAGKTYYYTNNNPYYKNNYGPNKKYLSGRGGYCVGNCTWYAYARASEILGKKLNSNFIWGADNWWSGNKKGNYYPYGSTPKVGAIACYNNHVAIVEKVENGKVYVSESGWTISSKCPKSASDIRFHYGTPWKSKVKGYIYITDAKVTTTKNVDYSIKISADNLNLRTGPGTDYSRVGYAKKGTYKVSQENGNWAKLAESGYWVCLSYATKIESAVETVINTGTTANYKVKISATNLNMRTGPATSYKSKGYINKGTYTVVLTNNGWGKISETGYWVSLKYTEKVQETSSSVESAPSTSVENKTYDVKVTASSLNMRTGPGTGYKSKGTLKRNKIVTVKAEKNGWGQISSNGYWIKLSYTTKVTSTSSSEYKVKVKAKDLNMRTGPGTSYKRKGYIKPGTYVISQTSNGWGKIKSNGYWIKLSYTTKL